MLRAAFSGTCSPLRGSSLASLAEGLLRELPRSHFDSLLSRLPPATVFIKCVHIYVYTYICIHIYMYIGIYIYKCGSVSDKGVTLQYPGAKYHVFNLSTSYVFILILSYVSICSMCYV